MKFNWPTKKSIKEIKKEEEEKKKLLKENKKKVDPINEALLDSELEKKK